MPDAGETRLLLRIEVGRAWLRAEDAGELGVGSRVELDCAADEGVEVFSGARRIARGTPAVLDGKLCVQVSHVPGGADAVGA
jgi:flagellar motor switch/type III secretory pathway protein FliN